MKNSKLTKAILAVVAVAALVVGCDKADDPELKAPADTDHATEATYPVDKIEFQKNGYMSDPDAKLLIENAKRSAALQVYIWSLHS